MKIYVAILIAGAMISAVPAYACSPADLIQKQKAFGDAAKAAFARDPAGDTARKAQVQTVIARYSDLKAGINGSYIIDMLCKENDELLAIYK